MNQIGERRGRDDGERHGREREVVEPDDRREHERGGEREREAPSRQRAEQRGADGAASPRAPADSERRGLHEQAYGV